MLVADSHDSRVHPECVAKAAELGFDIFLLPGGLTAYLQLLDQLFGEARRGFTDRMVSATSGGNFAAATRQQAILQWDDAWDEYFTLKGAKRVPSALNWMGLVPIDKDKAVANVRKLHEEGVRALPALETADLSLLGEATKAITGYSLRVRAAIARAVEADKAQAEGVVQQKGRLVPGPRVSFEGGASLTAWTAAMAQRKEDNKKGAAAARAATTAAARAAKRAAGGGGAGAQGARGSQGASGSGAGGAPAAKRQKTADNTAGGSQAAPDAAAGDLHVGMTRAEKVEWLMKKGVSAEARYATQAAHYIHCIEALLTCPCMPGCARCTPFLLCNTISPASWRANPLSAPGETQVASAKVQSASLAAVTAAGNTNAAVAAAITEITQWVEAGCPASAAPAAAAQ